MVKTGISIAHLDLDCFFVSVERIDDPSLRGQPVVVGGSPGGRGVVASASYEARKYGVRSAMPTAQALRLCPHLKVVRGQHARYSQYSRRLYHRMLELAPVVERASIDEMYLDFTGCDALYGNDLPGFMKTLQHMVLGEFTLPCSIGLASNKLVAKIATGTVKPSGVITVPQGAEADFLAPLPVDVIPGVGDKTAAVLRKNGMKLIADLQKAPETRLIGLLGVHGGHLFRAAWGKGSPEVHADATRKSISKEETFTRDLTDREEMEKLLFTLVEDVATTLRSRCWKAGTITLKLRYGDFTTLTRQRSVSPTQYDPELFREVRRLFRETYDPRRSVRLLGVSLSQFVDDAGDELPLYPADQRRFTMLRAVDGLRKKFGGDVIHLGGA